MGAMTKSKSRGEAVVGGIQLDSISTDGLLSDGSSFYGDEQVKANFVRYAAANEPETFWEVAQWNIQCIAAQAASRVLEEAGDTVQQRKSPRLPPASPDASGSRKRMKVTASEALRPYNPYEGDLMAKQLAESRDDFLVRLKPSETSVSDGGPWISVANPHSSHRPASEDIAGFKEAGSRALSDYLAQKRVYEQQNPGKTQGSITHMLKGDRARLESSIITLAKQHRVTCGKWMLFPTPDKVDAVWSVVTNATVDGRLGCMARVATDDGDLNSRVRLVCIYTNDFSDLQDVKRVVKQMQELGLLKGSKGDTLSIFYKCDAYTHLDIHSNNEYRLKASMYSSKELIPEK